MASATEKMETQISPIERDSEGFAQVKSKTRKRKIQGDVEMEEFPEDQVDTAPKRPNLPPISGEKLHGGKSKLRKIPVPSHRYTPLKENWMKIFSPVVDHLNLQIRFNLKSRNVELKTCKATKDVGALQKGADFVKAFMLGFEIEDSLALVRLDDLYLESFDVTDVKMLKGDHLARAVGRIAGKGGKTKYTIENVTKCRIVLADTKVHILGSFQNIRIARRAICNLILVGQHGWFAPYEFLCYAMIISAFSSIHYVNNTGSPPSKVYGTMRTIAARSAERF